MGQDQLQMAQDIKNFHKYSDNLQMENPEPKSSYFMRPEDRFNRDFAGHDAEVREQEKQRRQEI